MNKIAFICSIYLLLCACEKKEIPILPHQSGDVIVNSVNLGTDYRYQIFYSLKNNDIVSENLKTEWDLAFECNKNGNKIILNSSKYMRAANTNTTNFLSVSDTVGYNFKIDMPSGNLDSTAIGDWTVNNVYIIDKGYNELGTHLGFVKFCITNYNLNEYHVKFSDLNNTNIYNVTIVKDSLYNFKYLSFNGNIKNIEPQKNLWELEFTQYTHYFKNDSISYLVTGCLINRNNVEVAVINNKDFNKITIDDVYNAEFKQNINVIGYHWKEFSFETNQYIIFSNINYIIKSTDGFYYKFHFIDFYDTNGQKGSPTFEYQKL
jgi:hypothetical protein